MQTYEFTRSKDTPIDDIVATYHRWGIVHIPYYLDANTVEELTEEFFRFLEAKESWIEPRKNYHAGHERLIYFKGLSQSRDYPRTLEVFSSPFMRQVADKILGTPNHLNHEIMIHQDLPNPEKDITELHYDRLSTLKFFIYLKDTTSSNGAFECVPGSHHFARKVRNFYLQRGYRLVDFPNKQIPENLGPTMPIEGPAGTMFIFTTDLYHKGGHVSEGQERIVMRGHTHGREIQVYKPNKYSPQWWRESAYNPMRYVYKITDKITAAKPPTTI